VSDAEFRALARAAASGYPRGDRYAHHFAYGKLKGDPVFRWLLEQRLVAAGASVLDLGCGQGLVGALLFAAGVERVSYTGIDLREKDVERGRAMAEVLAPQGSGHAIFRAGDIRTAPFSTADLVVMLDVLHYIDYDAQAAILDRVTEALAPGGQILLRVADDDGSMSFRWTILADKLASRMRGHPVGKVYCRSLADWREDLQRRRLAVTPVPMSTGTLFANVALLARYDP
jgi:SAM-dependent methyltransferase